MTAPAHVETFIASISLAKRVEPAKCPKFSTLLFYECERASRSCSVAHYGAFRMLRAPKADRGRER